MKFEILLFILLLFALKGKCQAPDFSFNTNLSFDTNGKTKADEIIESSKINLTHKQCLKLVKNLKASNLEPMDYVDLCWNMHISIPVNERKELLKKLLNTENDSLSRAYYIKLFSDSINKKYSSGKGKTYSYIYYNFIDFDNDKIPDLIIKKDIYFGPSSGYKIYVRQGEKYTLLFSLAGAFTEFITENNFTKLHYAAEIIDPKETNITYSVIYDKFKKKSYLSSKLYFARQTVIPETRPEGIYFRLSVPAELRTSPVYDTATVRVGQDSTKTLSGNIVARMDKGSEGYILAEKGKWAFVVFKPESIIIERSLEHGLDWDCEISSLDFNKKCDKPWLAGWVEVHKVKD